MTVIGLKLQADGDLPVVSGFVDGIEAVANKVAARLRTHVGEWILDRTAGLPFIEWTQQKAPDTGAIASIVVAEILDTEGVVRVSNVVHSLDRATRKVSVSANVFTSFGELSVSVSPSPSQSNSASAVIVSLTGSGRIVSTF